MRKKGLAAKLFEARRPEARDSAPSGESRTND